ncbi:hypothetical protein Kisp01_67200 [Kineosporia sp. NBRC 101677]|nr:hypothetical protein Kisp01_67200 [Kineosporia sp. NBRC 101677]
MPIREAMWEPLNGLDDQATVRDAMSRLGVLVAQELRAVQAAECQAVRRSGARSA